MKYKTQRGMTLLELMIAVAIIGVLAVIALPAYQDYLAKAQASEARNLAEAVKAQIFMSFAHELGCPDNTGPTGALSANIAQDVNIQGKYVAKVTTGGTASAAGGCTVTAHYKSNGVNAKLSGKTMTFTLLLANATGRWTCWSDIDDSVRPMTCGPNAAGAR